MNALYLLSIAFIGFLLLEVYYPHHKLHKTLIRRSLKTNIILLTINSVIITVLLNLVPVHLPTTSYNILDIVTTFLLMDFILYGYHVLCHNYDPLWKYHKLHHNDIGMNVSTAFRLHFVEVLITNILKFGVGILVGIDNMLLYVNELVTTMFVMFHHSNIKIPHEQHFNKLIITPNMHRVHHAVERKYHDNNYGAVLSIWDIMFKTYKIVDHEVVVGLKETLPVKIHKTAPVISYELKELLPEKVHEPVPGLIQSEPVHIPVEWIEKAAYYKAMARGFEHGNDFDDWLEAERDVRNMLLHDQHNVQWA